MNEASYPQLRNASDFPTWPLLKRRAAAWLFTRSATASRIARHLGELADYSTWIKRNFGETPIYLRREELWEQVLPHLRQENITVMEFGVAWGYATAWWLQRLPAASLRWYGFDTFTGLPDTYRDMEPGTFSAYGRTPAIDDARVTWVEGLAEETIPGFAFPEEPRGRLFLFFDFDLYEPSLVAWERFNGLLKPGDILYFDESYDSNERRLIDEHLLPHYRFRAIGATTTTLALEYLGARAESPSKSPPTGEAGYAQ